MIIDGIDLSAYEGYNIYPDPYVGKNRAVIFGRSIRMSYEGYDEYQKQLRIIECLNQFDKDLKELLK